MKVNTSLIAACLVAGVITAACTGETAAPVPSANHDHATPDHDHAADDHDHDHSGDVHEGEPVVVHDAAVGPYSKVVVTFLRPTKSPVQELVFEVALTGPASTVRGAARSASGALSLTGKAEAEDEAGHFHLHVNELPADIETGEAFLVLSLTPDGAAPIELVVQFNS